MDARTARLRSWLPPLALLLAAGVAPASWADAYLVAPVSMKLDVEQSQGTFRVSNHDDHPIRVQVDVHAWTQSGDADLEHSTMDFIVSPRFATLPAGGSQVVRIALRHPAASGMEQSYRVLFRELPDAATQVSGVQQVLLDYSIPVFVAPATSQEPRLAWSLKKLSDSMLQLSVSNGGQAHGKITAYTLTAGTAAQEPLAQQQLLNYVLPGNSRHIQVPMTGSVARGQHVTLSVELDAHSVEIPLTVR